VNNFTEVVDFLEAQESRLQHIRLILILRLTWSSCFLLYVSKILILHSHNWLLSITMMCQNCFFLTCIWNSC